MGRMVIDHIYHQHGVESDDELKTCKVPEWIFFPDL